MTIASFSKTYAVTGWRVGFAAAPAPLMAAIRKVHDFLTVCAPAPFQRALATALDLPESYYREMAGEYRARHDLLSSGLQRLGWKLNRPQGGYFLLADLSELGVVDDREWAVDLARTRGVAGVPGSAFLWDGLPHEDRPSDRRGAFSGSRSANGPRCSTRRWPGCRSNSAVDSAMVHVRRAWGWTVAVTGVIVEGVPTVMVKSTPWQWQGRMICPVDHRLREVV